MPKLWTESKGAIVAGANDILKAEAIAKLLVRPIDLLPRQEGDPIKPFAVGVWTDIRALITPDTPVIALRRAISVYTHSKRYYLACAQPDAFRHDVDGQPVSPVLDDDRLVAQTAFAKLHANNAPTAPAEPVATIPPKASLIRAGIFGRNRAAIN